MADGIILYGPPASGKDTITAALTQLDARYAHFARLKHGRTASVGYRPATAEHLEQLRERQELLYENHRYGNTYAIDRPHLEELRHRDRCPVVHMGQVRGVQALLTAGLPLRWLPVLLWCSRETTQARSHGRGDQDTDRRLEAWDQTRAELTSHTDVVFALGIRTDQATPQAAAEQIHDHFTAARPVPPLTAAAVQGLICTD